MFVSIVTIIKFKRLAFRLDNDQRGNQCGILHFSSCTSGSEIKNHLHVTTLCTLSSMDL